MTQPYSDLDLFREIDDNEFIGEGPEEQEDDDYIEIGAGFGLARPEGPAQPERFDHTVAPEEAGQRVDKLLVALRPDLSRAHIQRLMDEKRLQINGKVGKPGQKLKGSEQLTLYIPAAKPLAHLEAENIPLAIVYEDESVIVINKPAGMVVHPAPGHASGTLVNALLHHVPGLNINGNQRPGIVHRLDKDTSGLLVAAKNDAALGHLIAQMKNHETLKEYWTLVEGNVQPPSGIVDAPIGRNPAMRKQMSVTRNGKPARTHYEVIEYLPRHSYVKARLETGRTHQIRVHFSYMKHPVAGDPVYGFRKPSLPLKRQFLHAHRLGFKLPGTGEYREFEADLPADLQKALRQAAHSTEEGE